MDSNKKLVEDAINTHGEDAVRKILESSNNEDEFIKNVSSLSVTPDLSVQAVELAKQKHGEEAVKRIADSSLNEEDFINNVKNLAVSPAPTVESRTIGRTYPYIEKAANILQYLGKPYSVMASPVMEAIGAVPKKDEYFGHGTIEMAKAAGRQVAKEFSQFEPTPESSVGYQLKKHGLLQQTAIENLPKSVEEQFPIASSKLKGAKVGDIVGLTSDIALAHNMPSVPIGKSLSSITSKLDEMAGVNRETALARAATTSGEDLSKSVNKAKIKIIGETLSDNGLTPLLSDEVALKDAIAGVYEPGFDELGVRTPVKTKQGLIDKLHGEAVNAGDFISKSSSPISAQELADSVYNKLATKLSDPASGAKWDASVGEKLHNAVSEIIKPEDFPDRSFGDLVKLKKSVADMYFDRMSKPELYSAEGALPKTIYKTVWDEIDNKINSIASSDPNVKEFVKTNADISNLMELNNMLEGAKKEKLQRLSVPEVALGAGAGYAAGSMMGHGAAGAVIGGMYRSAGPLARLAEEKIPAYTARAQEYLAGKTRPMRTLPVPQISGKVGALTQFMARRGIVENLADYEIPRSVDQILANKQMVLSKVAQVSNDPNMVSMLEDAFNKHPDKLEAILPPLIMQFPNIFEADKYNRVNGKILDPMLIQKAYKDVQNAGISNTEKAILQDGLNKNGSLPQTFK